MSTPLFKEVVAVVHHVLTKRVRNNYPKPHQPPTFLNKAQSLIRKILLRAPVAQLFTFQIILKQKFSRR